MLDFDLSRFRELAFGRQPTPDHPLADVEAVEKLVENLPGDALAGLAEMTHWAKSVNADDAFTTGRRARVLMALDTASRPFWNELAEQYLAPDGHPAEGHDGPEAILRAMIDSATAFATGFGFSLQVRGKPSRWAEKNLAHLALRRARWLARGYVLANMLHLPALEHAWEELHELYVFAEQHEVLRKVVRVHPGHPLTSTVKQEYTRLVLLDVAGLETLRGREMELVFRITGRIALNARLEEDPIPGALCAIEVWDSARPTAVRRLHKSRRRVLYLDAFNCLPRLKAMLERDMDQDLTQPDTLLGPGFTIRERNAMVHRVIDLWGPTPPQRRAKRIAFNAGALVRGGFESAVEVIPPLDQGDMDARAAEPRIRIVLDAPAKAKKAEGLRKALAQAKVRLVDASVGGLGLAVPRKEARWAKLGMLMAVYVEPGPDWVVGVLRRIHAEGDSLVLGVAILTRTPKLAWFRLEATGYASVWDEEKRHDRNFLEHFQRGIVLEADRAPLGPGDMLLAPGIAERGSRLEVPLTHGAQHLRVVSVRETTEDFARVAFDPVGVT